MTRFRANKRIPVLITDRPMRVNYCPVCLALQEMATCVRTSAEVAAGVGDTPYPGCLLVCGDCGALLVLDQDMIVREMSPEEAEARIAQLTDINRKVVRHAREMASEIQRRESARKPQ